MRGCLISVSPLLAVSRIPISPSARSLREAERPALIPSRGPFDGRRIQVGTVSKTCLVRFDHNRYSVMARAVGRSRPMPSAS